jgi:glucosamine-6-phosphate deaminase
VLPVPAPLVVADEDRVAHTAAEIVANRLRARPHLRLLLSGERTPLGMYAALRAHARHGELPAGEATVLQLDEYAGLGPEDAGSRAAALARELRGIPLAALHRLDGAAPDLAAECARHQALIDEAPLDLAVLGLGEDGHVAFDEPGSRPSDRVRRVALAATTIADAAPDFGGGHNVPREALTVGLSTLLAAREILLLVTGSDKAQALRATLEDPAGPEAPATMLKDHRRLTVLCDRAAASLLPR